MPGRRISRRVFLGAAGGAGIVAAAGGAAAAAIALRDDDAPRSVTGTRTSTPTRTPASAPTPTETPSLDPRLIFEPLPEPMVEVQTFAPGEPIEWPSGIFFMDIESGEVEGIRLDETLRSENGSPPRYVPLADGRHVQVNHVGGDAAVSFLYDRQLRISHRWSPDDFWATQAGRFMLFAASPNTEEHGELPAILVHEELQEVARIGTATGLDIVADPERGDLYWLVSSDNGTNQLAHLDALTGSQTATAVPDGLDRGPVQLRATVDGYGLHLRRADQAPDDSSDWPAHEGWVAPFGGDLVQLPGKCSHGTTPVISPDGQMFAYEEIEHAIKWYGEGLILGWPVVIVCSMATGEPLFRIRSAALFYPSEYQTRRWLADSSGLCIETRAEPLPGEASARGYRIVRVTRDDVTGFEELPPISARGRDGRERFPEGIHGGGIPSPFAPAKIALGKTAVYDTNSGRFVEANIAADAGPTDLDPWSAGRDEIVFTTPQLGRGARGPWPLLEPRVQEPPFNSIMRFVVSTPDGLHLRRTPGLDGEVIATLPYRAAIDLVPRGDDEPATTDGEVPEDPTTVLRHNETSGRYMHWAHVRTGAGERGWVSIDYLAWAT